MLDQALLVASLAEMPPARCALDGGVRAPQGTLVGVGMEFDSQRMIITSLRPGCAAAYSKQITIGDQLVSVDGQEVSASMV